MDGGQSTKAAGSVSQPASTARPRRIGWLQGVILALWAAFVLWTGYGAVTNLSAALSPPQFSNPYITHLNMAAPLFALNLWAFLAGLVFALGALNPFAWLNGKRLVFACTAFAMMLGRLATGFMAGPIAYQPLPNSDMHMTFRRR